jgi:(p)ppGpp synthase/HD superfamily hydrolase
MKQRGYPQDRGQEKSQKSKKSLGEQLKELQPKLPTFKEKQAEFTEKAKAKEEPELYAILGTEKILDIQSLEAAKK